MGINTTEDFAHAVYYCPPGANPKDIDKIILLTTTIKNDDQNDKHFVNCVGTTGDTKTVHNKVQDTVREVEGKINMENKQQGDQRVVKMAGRGNKAKDLHPTVQNRITAMFLNS